MKSKFQQLLEKAYEQIKNSNHSEDDLNSLSNEKLLDDYKKAFDKQFDGATQEDKEDLKKYFAEITKRGGKLRIQANNYADYKRNLER